MRIGSEEHKQRFCQSFIESHLDYEPEQMSLPKLDEVTLDRLQSVPFWDEALHTERKAGRMIHTYAETLSDPLLRAAISLQAQEEARHGRLIERLLNHYNIQVAARPAAKLPEAIEPAFIEFGYGECFDSFFAFGLFGIARQAGLIPDVLFTLFDPVLNEEARHMVFFVNWIAYQQAQEGWGELRRLYALSHYAGALQRRLGSLQGVNKKSSKKKANQKGFTATGASAFASHLTLEKFLATCLEENEKRMSVYDPQLLRPEVLPALSSLAFHILKLLPKRRQTPAIHAG